MGDIFSALGKPRGLEYAVQDQFPPSAKLLDVAFEHFGKAIGLCAQILAGLHDQLYLFLKRENISLFGLISRFDFDLKVLYALLEGFQKTIELLL